MTHIKDEGKDRKSSAIVDSEEEVIRQLLQTAGLQKSIADERVKRIYNSTEDAWRKNLQSEKQKKRKSRFLTWSGLACAAAVLLVMITIFNPEVVNQPQRTAKVVLVSGQAYIDGNPLSVGEDILSGQSINTGFVSGLALQLGKNQSLRLDANTLVSIITPRKFYLERGAIYFDSANENPQKPIQIITPIGFATDVGTQFEVRLIDDNVRIRVREGTVQFDSNRLFIDIETVAVNDELLVSSKGKSTISDIGSDNRNWLWVQTLTPDFELEGRTLDQFLYWIARENGWQLHYSSPELKRQASTNILHGSVQGMSHQEMLSTVVGIAGVNYKLEDQILTIYIK